MLFVGPYERALFLERSRRGKRHAAQAGSVSARPRAPYGYRYVGRQNGAAQPYYEVVPEEARVVRQVFAWVAHERLTLGAVARRLCAAGTPSDCACARFAAIGSSPSALAPRACSAARHAAPPKPISHTVRPFGAIPSSASQRSSVRTLQRPTSGSW